MLCRYIVAQLSPPGFSPLSLIIARFDSGPAHVPARLQERVRAGFWYQLLPSDHAGQHCRPHHVLHRCPLDVTAVSLPPPHTHTHTLTPTLTLSGRRTIARPNSCYKKRSRRRSLREKEEGILRVLSFVVFILYFVADTSTRLSVFCMINNFCRATFLLRPPPTPNTHTHTHTFTQIHTRTHTHIHTPTHPPTHPHTHTLSLSPALTLSLSLRFIKRFKRHQYKHLSSS